MSFSHVENKEDLPGYFKKGRGVKLTKFADGDFMCPKCNKYVDVDAFLTNIKLRDCFICENGHRFHFHCSDIGKDENGKQIPLCPKCHSSVTSFCKTTKEGYLYVSKTGGKHMSKSRKHQSKKKTSRKKRTQKKYP